NRYGMRSNNAADDIDDFDDPDDARVSRKKKKSENDNAHAKFPLFRDRFLHLLGQILPGTPRSIDLLRGQSSSAYFRRLLRGRNSSLQYVPAVARSTKIYKQELLENFDAKLQAPQYAPQGRWALPAVVYTGLAGILYNFPTIPARIRYTQHPSGIGATPAAYATTGGHTQPSSTGPAHAVQNPTSAINPPLVTSTGHIPTSSLGLPAAVTLSVPAPFASSSVSPIPRGEAPLSTSSASPTPAPVNASTILPSTTTYVPPPTPPTGTGPAPFASSSASSAPSAPPLGTGPAPAIEHIMNLSPVINPPAAMTTTSTGYGRELLDLAKIDTDETKHSGRNDIPTFELAKLWKNALNSLSKNFRMGSTGERGSGQAMRWMRWMKWDKTQDEMDEMRAGVG
ncbi:hypothetical protein MMC31_008232, partial [Peltigera leucophlebia]|nr:hypothetical protein [Peltigera leucophlebia]